MGFRNDNYLWSLVALFINMTTKDIHQTYGQSDSSTHEEAFGIELPVNVEPHIAFSKFFVERFMRLLTELPVSSVGYRNSLYKLTEVACKDLLPGISPILSTSTMNLFATILLENVVAFFTS